MDIMDNYPECTTQPHSCLQLRPKQLPPPLHPPSSPHDDFLQLFGGVGIFLTLTREGPARSTVGKTHHKCCLSRGKVQRWNRAVLGEEPGTFRVHGMPGMARWGGKEHFLKKRSCPISRGGAQGHHGPHVTWPLGIYEHSGLILVSLLRKQRPFAICSSFSLPLVGEQKIQ